MRATVEVLSEGGQVVLESAGLTLGRGPRLVDALEEAQEFLDDAQQALLAWAPGHDCDAIIRATEAARAALEALCASES